MRHAEGDKVISIMGFRDVEIGDVDAFLNNIKASIYPATIQVLDSMKIAGRLHLFFAFLNAKKAFEQGRSISENLEVETLLYASGMRQIHKAIELLGIKPNTSNIAVVLFTMNKKEAEESENRLINLISGIREDDVLEVRDLDKRDLLMETFGVTELEIKAMAGLRTPIYEILTWLIVERGALLSIKH